MDVNSVDVLLLCIVVVVVVGVRVSKPVTLASRQYGLRVVMVVQALMVMVMVTEALALWLKPNKPTCSLKAELLSLTLSLFFGASLTISCAAG